MNRAAIFILCLGLSVAGCASSHGPDPMPVLTQPVPEQVGPDNNPGSLFDSNQAEFLYDDNRAERVGDIVLVEVSEVSNAKHKSDTTAERDTNINFGVEAFPNGGVAGMIPFAKQFNLPAKGNPVIKAGAKNDFEGTGETKQESTFTATVATRIVRRLPGRILQVEGARRIRVNEETQILVVRGLVRQRDIRSDNTIPSSNLAEAQIEVYGEGVLTDKQRPGWLSRILDNMWPF
ncbi:MAG: flagellar basal body L-ring protein FlgH [Desulfovibrionaceae bacterium]|nr:flagellar basal body L-ring protein FlgH [Desulfovibrionaceae bacterium]